MQSQNNTGRINNIVKRLKYHSVILLGIISLISVGLFAVSKYSQQNSLSVNETVSFIIPVNAIRVETLQVLAGYRKLVAGKGENGLEYLEDIDADKKNFNDHIKVLLVNKKLMAFADIKGLNKNFNEIIDLGKKMALAYIEEDLELGAELTLQFELMAGKYEKMLKRISRKVTNNLKVQNRKSVLFTKKIQKVVFVLVPIILLITFLLSNKLTKSVKIVLDEETENIKVSIGKAVKDLNSSTGNLQNIAGTLTSTSNALNLSSGNQANSIKDSVELINRIKKFAENSSENTKHSLDISRNAQGVLGDGRHIVSKMADAMTDINASNKELGRISEIISEIFDKTQVINDIVFQTKLLSFNASIEAARAGQYGKGFSVVAEEIGVLAKQSGISANEIEELVTESASKVEDIITTLQKRVKLGENVAQNCVDVFMNIDEMNVELTGAVQEIAKATDEQQAGLVKTVDAIGAIDRATQDNLRVTAQTLNDSQSVVREGEKVAESVKLLNQFLDNKQENNKDKNRIVDVSHSNNVSSVNKFEKKKDIKRQDKAA